jgi:hypothetical protein
MFKDLIDELLDLRATVHGYRNAFLADTERGSLCCSCSCCCVTWQ